MADEMTDEKDPVESDKDIIQRSRDGLRKAFEAESSERAKMLDDLRFATLDQWPAEIRAQRENDVINGARPCLTIDQINQYITQISNDLRVNKPGIRIRPLDDIGSTETANVFQGLIRHIEDQSKAQIAYHTAGDSAVTVGLGFFRVNTQRLPKSFDQEIIIERVPDTFTVYLSHHILPDGSDAEEAWVFEHVQIEEFKRLYPGKKFSNESFDGLGMSPAWKNETTITVCEYFYKEHETEKLVYTADGQTLYQEEYEALPEPRPEITGECDCDEVTVKWVKHSGVEILDSRELPGKYIPIVEVVGKEKIVEGKRILWGLVRPAKDSLRAFNYWISALTEKMALAPKAPYIGAVGQFATNGDKWDKANVNNYSRLEYDPIDVNGNAVPAPHRSEPIQMEPAMAQMLSIMQNNVKSSLGMYKAALGESESQQSGKAILALQKESNSGTMHFGDNQAISIAQCGRIIVEWIPYYYDKKRDIRILGEDGKPQTVRLDPDQQEPVRKITTPNGVKSIYNLNVGRYDVTAGVGPSYQTSRQEASTVMTDLANTAKDPVSAAIMRYGAIKNSDFAGSEEITKMLEAMLPPQVKQIDENEPIPPIAQQRIAQMQQAGQALQQQLQQLTAENQQLKTGVQVDQQKINADHDIKMKAIELDRQVAHEKARLAREEFEAANLLAIEKMNAEIQLEKMRLNASVSADFDAAVSKIESLIQNAVTTLNQPGNVIQPSVQ